MDLVYRNKAGGQPWANRLAEEASLVYVLQLRDRCRSGLSGSPGKRVLGKTNRGFESLPVRTLVRKGISIRRKRYLDGSQGNGGPIPPCPTLLRAKRFAMALRRVGGQGINPDHKCKFQLLGLGKAVCPQPASFNIYTPKRSARRRRDAPPYLIFNLPKRTRRALRSVGPSCGERDTPVRPLPVIFFGDDSLEVEW